MTYLSPKPPLSIGTLIHNRYQILQVLGQGGFGRTYLAQDRNRFSETCVLKEFFPADTDPAAMTKARSLFQREAKVLYNLRHPQIPEFREQFEWEHQLFLVQEYIPGQTYAQLLKERLAIGAAFSEAEVRQLMTQVLPVLMYLHDRQIVHRDIAPDNIIQREADRLPVLIDFGAVKELANRISQAGISTPTVIGKPAYAPPEQMQHGDAKPSSDLYALAATAVVLLTGKAPDQLYDAFNCRWKWQSEVTVSPDFAAWLNQMLHFRPEARFYSAIAALKALQSLTSMPVQPIARPVVSSQMPTQAIGQRLPSMPVAQPNQAAMQWQPLFVKTGKLLFRLGRWSLRLVGKTIWLVWQVILSVVPKWVLFLALLTGGFWGYRQLTNQPITFPKLPTFELPKISPPKAKPTNRLPSATNLSQPERSRRDALLNRMSEMGVPAEFFYDYVDTQFRTRHPEFQTKALSDSSKERALREDWYRIGETLLQQLDRLDRPARQQLSRFDAGDQSTRRSQLRQLNLSEGALDVLADTRLRHLFPNYSALPDLHANQLKHAIATHYITQFQSHQGIEKYDRDRLGTQWGDQHRKRLNPGTGNVYLIPLKTGQNLEFTFQGEGRLRMFAYSRDSKPLLKNVGDGTHRIKSREEDGYYELIVVSKEPDTKQYRLGFKVQ
ncbi:MAG TPA: serine/threonine protein kinase [Leptolyngbyaceae cyanobacterium M33_DOE_097]|uniref:non-specific serine/threonine protein kinase n=1 Tax=Oscillatoriales cyanobacterium SpSt-418 TaxID=2282169 RepID=A0A7C3PM80_9CYAN|nr:serine/threonine protein kinase [Leptolyngbyaceae cyanobacterium M33_DOE_097]